MYLKVIVKKILYFILRTAQNIRNISLKKENYLLYVGGREYMSSMK